MFGRRLRVALMLSPVALLVGSGWAQTIFNPTTDFSIVAGNPNGTWTYGSSNQGDTGFSTFTAYSNTTSTASSIHWYGWNGDATPGIWKNTGGSTINGVPAGYLSIHPGPGTEPSILRWTAPTGFDFAQVTGQFLAGDTGIMSVAVRKNGSAIWSAVDAGSFDLGVTLTAGDFLDFAVFGGWASGNTPLALTITAVPEPSTCVLLSAGLTAAVLTHRRRRAGSSSAA